MKGTAKKWIFFISVGILLVGLYLDGSLEDVISIGSGEIAGNTQLETIEQVSEDIRQPEVVEIVDPDRPGYNMGRCATLKEDAHVVAFFLDDLQGKWTPEEAKQFTRDTIQPGLDFIHRQAAIYGVDVTLNVTPYYTNSQYAIEFDGVFGDRMMIDDQGRTVYDDELTDEDRSIVHTIASSMGYQDYEDMYKAFQTVLNTEQIAFMIIPKKPGFSYAISDRYANGFVGLEHCVLYAQNYQAQPNEGREAAYQLLRLFGAGLTDNQVEGRESTASVARRLYPYSVMWGGSTVENAFVDPYTAYAIGWTNVLPIENSKVDVTGGTPQKGDPNRPKFDKGVCRNLNGRISIVTIFLDDEESSWTQQEIESFYSNSINTGIDFLIRQAGEWGNWLEIEHGYYATEPERGRNVRYQGVIKKGYLSEEYNQSSRDILDQAAISLGFTSKVALYESLKEQTGTDQVAIVIALNKQGRNYAVLDQDENGNDSLEYCLVFTRYWDTGDNTGGGSVVHEVLHLFGAEDLYEEYNNGARAGRAALAKKSFPNDIMLTEYRNINANVIDDFTAYAIGWSDIVPPECLMEEWNS